MALCMGEEGAFSEELTCAVCLDSWKDPVEIVPCGHIYCRGCLVGTKQCPTCRGEIKSTTTPNRTLINMALNVKVKCAKCGWRGTRENSERHVCSSKVKNEAPAPAPVAGSQNFFPQSAANGGRPPNASTGTPYTYNYDQFQGYPNGGNAAQQPPATGVYYNGGVPNQSPQQPYVPPNMANRRYEVIEPVGACPWNLYGLTQEEYDQTVSIFVFFDEDESGSLDRNEVARLTHWLNYARTESEVNRIFMDMDADGSGTLSLGEFLTWLKYNKPNPKALYGLNQKQYSTIMMQFHSYDRNQDGCLDFEEFARLVINLGDVPNRDSAMRLFRMIDRQGKGTVDLHQFLSFRAGKRYDFIIQIVHEIGFIYKRFFSFPFIPFM